ncbi:hypothetical protein AVEN_119812-1 [Araneus ventricosus]|uniref:Uncharacterized protein n=1 Tax=Araneus ventricosus TaxID=182803 RepID=A0A4Y2RA06_ARAVE|nr:hypothetical protein AVEN_119812-1 [Araneus ventricosus]
MVTSELSLTCCKLTASLHTCHDKFVANLHSCHDKFVASLLQTKIAIWDIAEPKVVFQWCVDQGLIASGYECPKCKRQMVLSPRRDISDGFNGPYACDVTSSDT